MKRIMITGGTGSFGQALTKRLLKDPLFPEQIVIFSRDEYKQSVMIDRLADRRLPHPRLRFVLGDVRDSFSVEKASRGSDVIIHAAALKQVPLGEYNPYEVIQTNVLGAQNVIQAAIKNKVGRVIALSTDKAVDPINLYGATKLCAEKLFINANVEGRRNTAFSMVRYGNVLASRGSVLQLFRDQLKAKVDFTITDMRMTRFWFTLGDSVELVMKALGHMAGGEIFIPKLMSSRVYDLARALSSTNGCQEIGIRPGEKMHERLISRHEHDRTYDIGWCYVVLPAWNFFRKHYPHRIDRIPHDFDYESQYHSRWMSRPQLRKLIERVDNEGKDDEGANG